MCQVAAERAVTDRIAASAQIYPPFSPGGANVTPSNTWFFGPMQSSLLASGISIGSSVFSGLTS